MLEESFFSIERRGGTALLEWQKKNLYAFCTGSRQYN